MSAGSLSGVVKNPLKKSGVTPFRVCGSTVPCSMYCAVSAGDRYAILTSAEQLGVQCLKYGARSDCSLGKWCPKVPKLQGHLGIRLVDDVLCEIW